MSYNRILIAAALLLLFTRCGDPKANTEEELGERLFEAIKDRDTGALSHYVFNSSDGAYLLKKLKISNDERAHAQSYFDYRAKNWARIKPRLLNDLRNAGRQHGVDWNTVVYDSIVKKTQFRDGVYKSDITVYLHPTPDGKIGRLLLDDCTRSDRGWVVFDDVTLRF